MNPRTVCKIFGCRVDDQACLRCGEHEYYGYLFPGLWRRARCRALRPRGLRWLWHNRRYFFRRWLGWFPWQPCLGCRRWYWGGLPWRGWQAVYQDFCTEQCHDENDIPF